MSRFTAQGLTYPEAITLIAQLKLAGIEANITSGGVAIHPEPQQINTARDICKAAKASFRAGLSSHQEDVLIQGGLMDSVERVTNNSRAIEQEWK